MFKRTNDVVRFQSTYVAAIAASVIASVALIASASVGEANSHKGGGSPTIFTDYKSVTIASGPDQKSANFDFGSSKEILSVSIEADTLVPCTATIARDLADTPAGSDDFIFIHTFHEPGTVHHNFAVPVPITTNPILAVVLVTGGPCAVEATITLK